MHFMAARDRIPGILWVLGLQETSRPGWQTAVSVSRKPGHDAPMLDRNRPPEEDDDCAPTGKRG
jgi:hypothetical protein